MLSAAIFVWRFKVLYVRAYMDFHGNLFHFYELEIFPHNSHYTLFSPTP